MTERDVRTNSLEELFRSEIRCTDAEATILAAMARGHIAGIPGTSEDSDEDIAFRLRDPRIFGGFAASLLGETRLSHATRIRLAEQAFDLLTLPSGEDDVFTVDSRAPERLLAIAAFLLRAEAFTVLHALHLAYSVFLDRRLVTAVDPENRGFVLSRLLAEGGASPGLRVLYAGLHLSAITDREARDELSRVLASQTIPEGVKRGLAGTAAAPDGGASALRQLAQEEGLLPRDLTDPQAPEVVANIPRLSPLLAAPARAWLAQSE